MAKRLIAAISVLLFLAPLVATEKEPVGEYKSRRDRLAKRIAGNVFVLRGAPDQDLVEFQQEDNFYYLTGFDEAGAILIIDASIEPAEDYLFVAERRESQERWTGERLDPGADTAKSLGFNKVLSASEFDETLARIKSKAKDELTPGRAAPFIAELRQIKSATEIALLDKAIQITMKAHQAAARTIAPDVMEYEVEAALEYEFRRNGAERPAFPSIVGSGPFSTVLHYDKNSRRMKSGEVVVIDIGAEYSGYAADITRTYPVSGRFSSRQRAIYQIVLDAQKAALERVKPGNTIRDVHQAAMEHIREKGYGKYFIHGTSHHIGLRVHDVGPIDRLEANMVLTVEPGIYIPDENLGIRIEDDVLVTQTGYRILSNFPKEIAEIEALVRR